MNSKKALLQSFINELKMYNKVILDLLEQMEDSFVDDENNNLN